jgi:hypothetical protein
MDMGHEETSVMAYNTLFDASGIHHSDTVHQITHDMYINSYFMLLFDLTPDWAASAHHKSHPDNGVVRIVLRIAKPLPETITCLLYLEYDSTVLVDTSIKEWTRFRYYVPCATSISS